MKILKLFYWGILLSHFISIAICAQVNKNFFEAKNRSLFSNASDANLILYNANVITFDENMPSAEAVAIEGKHILAVGTNDDILALQNSTTQLIDLGGRTLLPGLIEAHSHRLTNAYYANGIEGLKKVAEDYAKDGYTTVHELAINDTGFIEAVELLAGNNELALRVNLYLNGNDNCNNDYDIWEQYPLSTDKEALTRIIGVKIFADGGTCGMYPALSLPYIGGGAAGTTGHLFKTQNEMNDLVRGIVDAGYPVAMHAIGDAAAEIGLNAFENAFNGNGNQLRCRMEHLRLLSDAMIEQMAQLNIGAAIQYTWARASLRERFESAYDPELLSRLYRWKDLADSGIRILGTNDFPYTTAIDAMETTSLVVTRKESRNEQLVSWLDNQSLTVEQALHAMTINNAWIAFEEEVKGTITTGKLADLTVLSDDPFTVDPFDIRYIDIEMTVMDGMIRYNKLRIPTYAVHDAGDISVGIYDDGKWGKKYSLIGLEYNGYEHMYYGTLIISYDENTTGVDMIQKDFTNSAGGWIDFNESGIFADEEASVIFEDYISAHPRQLQIVQESYMWTGQKYLLIPYTITNIGPDLIDDVYIGFWADFDTGHHANNMGGWNWFLSPLVDFAYLYNPDDTEAPYLGMTIIDSNGDYACGTVEFTFTTGISFYQWDEADLSSRVRAATIQNKTDSPADYGILVASRDVFSFAPGTSSNDFNLVIAVGDNIEDLHDQITDARYKYNMIINSTAEKAVRFSGQGDYIEITNSDELNPDQITVELWFRARDPYLQNQSGGEQILLDKPDESAGYNLRLVGTEYPLSIQAMFGEPNVALAENVIEQNVWYHAAATQDGSEVKLYLNGLLVAYSLNTSVYESSSSVNLRIGEFVGYPWYTLGFIGDVDELCIWNYARSPEQIAGDVEGTVLETDPGLAGYWNFNSIANSVAEDQSVWNNDGVINGNIRLVNFSKNVITEVEDELENLIPTKFQLYQSYPNPFNPSTKINYQIPEAGIVTLKVYDVLGREVTELVNDFQPAGFYSVEFNSNSINAHLSSGIYIYSLNVNGFYQSKKMMLIK
ncbi:amidohydrolase family protein [Bacteroidota bacterium]